ncbi:vegetative cell wall protein gp1-like [Triticum urartu]|uniref:vegetative cell wall protein gp1-like n=1 Tax=Triticum urartu TaxID=4572 RepID=UPI002042C925|nr:vegetative cell wall protein gp1-like [Triticum urartu]
MARGPANLPLLSIPLPLILPIPSSSSAATSLPEPPRSLPPFTSASSPSPSIPARSHLPLALIFSIPPGRRHPHTPGGVPLGPLVLLPQPCPNLHGIAALLTPARTCLPSSRDTLSIAPSLPPRVVALPCQRPRRGCPRDSCHRCLFPIGSAAGDFVPLLRLSYYFVPAPPNDPVVTPTGPSPPGAVGVLFLLSQDRKDTSYTKHQVPRQSSKSLGSTSSMMLLYNYITETGKTD